MNTVFPNRPQWWPNSLQVPGGGVLLLLYTVLPSVQAPHLWDSTQSGKFLFFGYCVLVAFLLLVVEKIVRPPAAIRFTWLDVALLVLFIFLTVNRFVLQGPPRFLPGYYQLAGLMALYVLLRQADPALYGYLCAALVAGAVVQVGYGCLQLYGLADSNHPLFRLTGSFYNPGPYAGYLATALPAALALNGPAAQPINGFGAALVRLRVVVRARSVLAMTGLLGVAVMLPATLSRAAWLAAGVSTMFLLHRRYPQVSLPKHYPRALTGGALALALAAATGGLYLLNRDSGDGRVFIWKVTLGMIGNSPWVGTGPGGFKAGYMDRQAAYLAALPGEPRPLADNITVAYNEYLQFAAENGLVGLLLLAGAVAALVAGRGGGVTSPAAANGTGKADTGRAGIMAVGVFSLFSYPSEILPIQINLVFFLALAAAGMASKPVAFPVGTPRRLVFTLACRSAVLGAVAVVCVTGVARLYAVGEGYRHWKTAFDLYARNQYPESLAAYRDAYPVLDREGDFLTKYGKALSVAGWHREAIGVLRRGEAYQDNSVLQIALGESYKALGESLRAEAAYQKACRMVPGQFYPMYLLARLYQDTGQTGKAIRVAQALLAKEETIRSRAVDEMKLEMQQLVLYAK